MLNDTPLYRLENPEAPNDYAGGKISHPELLGQWFFGDIRHTFGYVPKVVFRYPDYRESAQLVVARVATEDLDQYKADRHPIASGMHFDDIDYIIPRDGSVSIETFSIQSLLKMKLRWSLHERMQRQNSYDGFKIERALSTIAQKLEDA